MTNKVYVVRGIVFHNAKNRPIGILGILGRTAVRPITGKRQAHVSNLPSAVDFLTVLIGDTWLEFMLPSKASARQPARGGAACGAWPCPANTRPPPGSFGRCRWPLG